MQDEIERDLKAALLAGDKQKVETLKIIKSALLYEAVNRSLDRAQMTDEQVQLVMSREAKKRQEAADMYRQGGENERADKELEEKVIIEKYLPEQLGENELAAMIDLELVEHPEASIKDMGKIIGAVKTKTGSAGDGALIARLVKEKLTQWY